MPTGTPFILYTHKFLYTFPTGGWRSHDAWIVSVRLNAAGASPRPTFAPKHVSGKEITSYFRRGFSYVRATYFHSQGERTARCLWQNKQGERVAAVDKTEEGVSPMILSGTATGSLSSCLWMFSEHPQAEKSPDLTVEA